MNYQAFWITWSLENLNSFETTDDHDDLDKILSRKDLKFFKIYAINV